MHLILYFCTIIATQNLLRTTGAHNIGHKGLYSLLEIPRPYSNPPTTNFLLSMQLMRRISLPPSNFTSWTPLQFSVPCLRPTFICFNVEKFLQKLAIEGVGAWPGIVAGQYNVVWAMLCTPALQGSRLILGRNVQKYEIGAFQYFFSKKKGILTILAKKKGILIEGRCCGVRIQPSQSS